MSESLSLINNVFAGFLVTCVNDLVCMDLVAHMLFFGFTWKDTHGRRALDSRGTTGTVGFQHSAMAPGGHLDCTPRTNERRSTTLAPPKHSQGIRDKSGPPSSIPVNLCPEILTCIHPNTGGAVVYK